MINICQSNILRSNQLIRNYFSNNSKENSENAFLIVRTSNRNEIMKLSMKCFQIVWDVLHPIRWLDTQKMFIQIKGTNQWKQITVVIVYGTLTLCVR